MFDLVPASAAPPNVILVMTDDQGYGDFGMTGNKVIETPHLDALAAQSVWMRTFYVSPVCSPTRASLMTGRYNYRTRCIDTYLGRSMMDASEVTVAEVLRGAGYATGIFGKWHLGDCYPMRAMDQGFEESLVLRGGGLAQPADPPGNDRRYTNPILMHNGEPVETDGYCTDVYFDAALEWIERAHAASRPFFAYIPTNAPHSPFHDVPEALRKHYRERDLSGLIASPSQDPQRRAREVDTLERIAAMITNIDESMGRLMSRLDELGISENTLVLFLVDNGPNTARYVGPFRGQKSEVFEGGVRSPFWMRWPGKLEAGYARDEPVAHIDVMPTILEACGVPVPEGVALDGRSFWTLANGSGADWPERPIVIQSHRGDAPVRFHQFMIRQGDWKLLNASGFGRETLQGEPKFELYDVVSDPGERNNLFDSETEMAERLKAAYSAWFDDVSSTRPDNYAPPRIHVGTEYEDPTVLTRQDWRGGTWDADSIGYWLVTAEAGTYGAVIRFDPRPEAGVLELRIGGNAQQIDLAPGVEMANMQNVALPAGECTIQAIIHHGDAARGIYQMELRKR